METNLDMKVSPAQSRIRLDRYLSCQGVCLSRTKIQEMIAARLVLVNGRAAVPGYLVKPGDRVQVTPRPEARERPGLEAEDIPLKIVFEDEHLLVVDKPHFLPVMPAGAWVEQTLLARLVRRLGNPQLVPLHRIDRPTAGLVLFSTNPASRAQYQALFRERQIDKHYEAIAPALPQLQFPLQRATRLVAGEPFFRMQEGPGTPNSETRIEVLERHGELWRYALYPVTGKKHQLRVHLAALGAPICNDPFYPELTAAVDAADDFDRPLKLLARGLRFRDPLSGEQREFASRLQLDW